jgi:hypothetical protein
MTYTSDVSDFEVKLNLQLRIRAVAHRKRAKRLLLNLELPFF